MRLSLLAWTAVLFVSAESSLCPQRLSVPMFAPFCYPFLELDLSLFSQKDLGLFNKHLTLFLWLTQNMLDTSHSLPRNGYMSPAHPMPRIGHFYLSFLDDQRHKARAIVAQQVAVHMAKPVSVPHIPYGSLKFSRVTPECRGMSKSWAIPGVVGEAGSQRLC